MSARLDQEREQKLQPQRLESCREKLQSLGFDVTVHGEDRLEFLFQGFAVRFWPYSGWHSGKTIKDGRGFQNLLRQVGGGQ